MPGVLNTATVSPTATVLPRMLFTSFVESNVYPIIQGQYHDGTQERSLITDGVNAPRSCRVWKLATRLTASKLATLFTFWDVAVQGGHKPFFFYDPYDTAGTPVGSNFDATGVSTQGRVTVVFRGNWSQSTDAGRSNVPSLELVETA